MSKKARARYPSPDIDTTVVPEVPQPAVFRDMRIEEDRISDGRRILYFSWPGDEPAESAVAHVEPATFDEPPEASGLATSEPPGAGSAEPPAADEDWVAAELPPEDEDASDV